MLFWNNYIFKVPTNISLTIRMSDFRKTSSGHSATNALGKTLTVFGCLLFLFSFIFPFCYALLSFPLGPSESWSTYYWSYSVDSRNVYTTAASVVAHYWYFDYWFNQSYGPVGFGMPWILISLFTVQALTLMFGVLFIVCNRRILSFEPIMLSIATVALMTYTGWVVSGDALVLSFQYQLGYYVVYPAIAMFLFAFLLNEVTKIEKQQIEKLNRTATEVTRGVKV
jgi:ABC-type multidrug transport system fused ATPase/permease subunit